MEETLNNGARLIERKAYSNHKGDWYLAIVLAENEKGEFVTWLENSSGESAYTAHGHYYKTLAEAKDDFDTRGKITTAISFRDLVPDSGITDPIFQRDLDRYMSRDMPSFPLGLLDLEFDRWEQHSPEIETEETPEGFLSESGELFETEEEAREDSEQTRSESQYGYPWAHMWCFRPDERITDEELWSAGYCVYTYSTETDEYRLCGIDGGGYGFDEAHHARLYCAVATGRGWTVNTEDGPKRVIMGGA
jgi:hypothetical protein